jgi:hypothetical protein
LGGFKAEDHADVALEFLVVLVVKSFFEVINRHRRFGKLDSLPFPVPDLNVVAKGQFELTQDFFNLCG